MPPYHDDDEMHMNATLLPSADNDSTAEQSTTGSNNRATTSSSTAQDDTSDAPRAIRDRKSANPVAATSSAMPQLPGGGPKSSNNSSMRTPSASHIASESVPLSVVQHQLAPPMMHQQAPVAFPPTNAAPADNDFVRVSEQCTATRCLRVQWEAEMNPRFLTKTTITNNGSVYLFDGVYLLSHGEPPSVPQVQQHFEYTRGGVMCKMTFLVEDIPSIFRIPLETPADPETGRSPRKDYCNTLTQLQRYLFTQLLGILPVHLFIKIFPDPARATGDGSDICSDYHIIPRFIAMDQQPLLNKPDLLAPHRIGFAVGNLLSIDQIFRHLDEAAKFSVVGFLMAIDSHQLMDQVISTRVNGVPGVFRIDGVVYNEKHQNPGESGTGEGDSTVAQVQLLPPGSVGPGGGIMSRDGREVLAIRHQSEGAWNYDGAKAKKKIRKWQELGEFLQLSPRVDPFSAEFNKLHECHLTGLRTDLYEMGSAMTMVLKHIRHCGLLKGFEENMGFTFKDKSLLRQAFTHGSYVDIGMQSVNTYEGARSRSRLGHVFENTASLKRSRSMLYEQGDVSEMDQEMKKITDKHLATSEFKEEFHSRFSCPYERLEFLGDAVLSFLVASSTFLKLPNANEGFLHQTRVDIVNNDNLGKIARTANFESLLLSAFDLTKLKDETTSKIVADCFEALLGALYKDQGIVPCRALLGKLMSLYDDELRELFFLSTDEVAEKASEYVEIDRKAIQSWSKLTETRIKHRRFTARTKVEIRNTHLWLQCMTHTSFKAPQIAADEFICADPSYERIEFLGDSVLQLLSSAFLVDAFPYYQEHLLTQARSSLVKNTRLAVVARDAGYEEFLRLGTDAKKESSNLYVEDVLADSFEATLGAVFLENYADLGKVNAILEKTVFPLLKEAIRRREWMNPRKVFAHHIQQWSAASMRPIDCKFKTIKRAPEPGKPNGQEGHSVALYVNNFLVARAMGRTITAAQDAACSKALQLYGMKFT